MDDIMPNVEDAESRNQSQLMDELDADEYSMPDDLEGIAEDLDAQNAIKGETNTHIAGRGEHIQCTPHIGMEFPTAEYAYNYYNDYSKKRGFCTRKHTTYIPRNSLVATKRMYVCNKEGHKRFNDKREARRDIKRRRDEREGCMARMVVQLTNKGAWVVKTFYDVHNHDMVFSQKKKGILRIKRKNNISHECMRNIQQFLERQAMDGQFYYAIEIDEERVCRSIFWADGTARTSYMQFHDVLVFDITYKINNFFMPFVSFTGVNHHRQSTVFGCALLADEQEETFVWLFKQLLKCMWGKAPAAIITNQDSAIRNAVKRVLPNTCHRYCIWHIRLHEDKHLHSLRCSYNPDFDEDYTQWAKKSKSVEDSENYWMALKEKYKISYEDPMTDKQKNEVEAWSWLQSMYEQRHHWVRAYLKGTFFAGMKSSKGSKSMNAFFDGFVNSMTPLSRFIQQYDKALKFYRDKEEKENLTTMRMMPDFSDMHRIEAHAGRVYTRRVFDIFQKEFKDVFRCWHKKVGKEGSIAIYDVYGTFKGKVSMHTVTCNTSDDVFTCSCTKFETAGLLCKHILYIMKQKLDMKSIPERYLLARWTLNARHTTCFSGGLMESNNAASGDELTPFESWTLQTLLNKMHGRISRHRDLYEVTKVALQNLWKQFDMIEEARQVPIDEPTSQVGSTVAISQGATSSHITIRDPIKPKRNGRATSRISSGQQFAQAQSRVRTRTCSACGEKGHDIRTCSKAKESH